MIIAIFSVSLPVRSALMSNIIYDGSEDIIKKIEDSTRLVIFTK